MHSDLVDKNVKIHADFDYPYQHKATRLSSYTTRQEYADMPQRRMSLFNALSSSLIHCIMAGNRYSTIPTWRVHCQILRTVKPDLFKMMRNWSGGLLDTVDDAH